jgi:hypothetical protein
MRLKIIKIKSITCSEGGKIFDAFQARACEILNDTRASNVRIMTALGAKSWR